MSRTVSGRDGVAARLADDEPLARQAREGVMDGAARDTQLVGDRLQADLRPASELAGEQARLHRVVDLIVEVEPDNSGALGIADTRGRRHVACKQDIRLPRASPR